MLLLVVLRPEIALTTYLLLYAASGPVLFVVRRFRRREAQPVAGAAADTPQTPQQRISKEGPA
jgi:hypothetical protein